MGIQDRIAEIAAVRLQPAMEAVFDEVCGDQKRIVLERLDLDCGLLEEVDWEEQWVEAVLRNLRMQLLSIPATPYTLAEEEAEAIDSFLYFLEHGRFSWKRRFETISELEAWLPVNQILVNQLTALLQKQPSAARRLVQSVSKNFRKKLLLFFPGSKGRSMRHHPEHPTVFSEEILWQLLGAEKKSLPGAVPEQEPDASVKPVTGFTTLSGQEIRLPGELAELKLQEKQLPASESALYVSAAGLVLLHPFLFPFFTETGLRVEGHWCEEGSRHLAVRLLHFLATGEKKFNEPAFVFEKLLCGFEPDDLLDDRPSLTEEQTAAGEVLLSEVIGHWTQLKNTGIEAFRQTFLQRSGKLTRVDGGWLLQVEHKAVDVLLSYLPWGIGVVHLPWMKDLLYVEWA